MTPRRVTTPFSYRSGLFLATLAAAAVSGGVARAEAPPAGGPATKVYLDTMDLTEVQQVRHAPQADKSVDGHPLSVGGKKFDRGIGSHAPSEIPVALGDGAVRFHAIVGVDDETGKRGSVRYTVMLDDKVATKTAVLRGDQPAVELDVDVTGAKIMRLQTDIGADDNKFDHADWADAYIEVKPAAKTPPQVPVADPQPELPIATVDNHKLNINGPRIVGTTPGHPFLFLIPATGTAPITFSAAGLPAGLSLDGATGVITGKVDKAGTTTLQLSAKDASGSVSKPLTIVAGDHKLSLTPAMGWNSWNVWGTAVDGDKIKAAADSLVKSGLAAHGFQFINIDDAWEDGRDEQGRIKSNEKFPDMKALSDYVHSKGLKLGIYSSPGEMTCGDYTGSYKHEQQDAQQYADWGIDYLKYDWCSYRDIAKPDSVANCMKPYTVMRQALDSVNRDIVYSLCQYGMCSVWEWGAKVGGNSWRTTGDIRDTWRSMSGIGFGQDAAAAYAEPGHWNDPDMLVVGKLGWGPKLHDTQLSHNEQITHLSLWSLLASPLLIGCDMTQMDDFTINLLSNDEVIAIDQDSQGQAARRRSEDGQTEVWSRPLADGTIVVGLFNRGWDAADVTARWEDIKVSGKQSVRDLWQQKDLGEMEGSYKAHIPAHGCMLIKVGKPRS